MFAASYLSTSPYHVASPSPLPSLDPSLPRSVSFAAPIITPTPSPFQPPILEHHYSYDSDEPAYILGHSTDSAPSSLHASSPFSDSSSEQEAAIYVHSFSPEYGEAGTMLTVVVELPPSLRNGNKARLAINGTPLLTNMTEAPSRISDGMWELNACVPVVGKRDASTSTPEMLAIVIEAFNDEGRHIHTIDVGQFSYSSPGKANLPPLSMSSSEITPHSTPTNPLKRRAREEDDDDDDDADYTPRAASHPRKHRKTRSGDKWTTSRSSCSPKTAKRVPPKLDLVNDAAGHKFLSPPIMSPLVRAGTYAPLSDDPAPKGMISPGSNADVKFEGDLSDMAHSWTPDELDQRRRIVRFSRRQEGPVVFVGFEPLAQEDYTEDLICVSCIYFDDKDDCFITSVDTISLLQSLVNVTFSVEEKNRIRRNLEGFRPLTISKGRNSTADFFQLIMDFPSPKPRNIEKDLKVFPWQILSAALKKIISKYQTSYIIPTESPPSPLEQLAIKREPFDRTETSTPSGKGESDSSSELSTDSEFGLNVEGPSQEPQPAFSLSPVEQKIKLEPQAGEDEYSFDMAYLSDILDEDRGMKEASGDITPLPVSDLLHEPQDELDYVVELSPLASSLGQLGVLKMASFALKCEGDSHI